MKTRQRKTEMTLTPLVLTPLVLARRWAIALVTAFGMGNALHAQQATTVNTLPKKDIVMTATITPQEFTQRFVRLVSERKGYVSHDRIETILGFTDKHPMERTRKAPPLVVESIRYGYAPEPRWPASISLYEHNENFRGVNQGYTPAGPSSELSMDLSPNAFGDWERGQCVVAHDVIQTLLDAGWQSNGKRIWAGPNAEQLFDFFDLGDGRLWLWHYAHVVNRNEPGQSCVHKVRVTGKP